MEPPSKDSPEFKEFCHTASQFVGKEVHELDVNWLSELFASADGNTNRAINYVMNAMESGEIDKHIVASSTVVPERQSVPLRDSEIQRQIDLIDAKQKVGSTPSLAARLNREAPKKKKDRKALRNKTGVASLQHSSSFGLQRKSPMQQEPAVTPAFTSAVTPASTSTVTPAVTLAVPATVPLQGVGRHSSAATPSQSGNLAPSCPIPVFPDQKSTSSASQMVVKPKSPSGEPQNMTLAQKAMMMNPMMMNPMMMNPMMMNPMMMNPMMMNPMMMNPAMMNPMMMNPMYMQQMMQLQMMQQQMMMAYTRPPKGRSRRKSSSDFSFASDPTRLDGMDTMRDATDPSGHQRRPHFFRDANFADDDDDEHDWWRDTPRVETQRERRRPAEDDFGSFSPAFPSQYSCFPSYAVPHTNSWR